MEKENICDSCKNRKKSILDSDFSCNECLQLSGNPYYESIETHVKNTVRR